MRGAAAHLTATSGVEDGPIRERPNVVQEDEVAALRWVGAFPCCDRLQLKVGAGGPGAPCDVGKCGSHIRICRAVARAGRIKGGGHGSERDDTPAIRRPVATCRSARPVQKCGSLLVEAEPNGGRAVRRKPRETPAGSLIAKQACCTTSLAQRSRSGGLAIKSDKQLGLSRVGGAGYAMATEGA